MNDKVRAGPVSLGDWLTVEETRALLRRVHKEHHSQSLYDRIHRGTLRAAKRGRMWFIPRAAVLELLREPYRPQGGRPRKDRRSRFEMPDPEQLKILARVSPARRVRVMLDAQAFLKATLRARLRRQYPSLSRRELNLKLVQELARGA